MKKTTQKMKALVLALAMATSLLLPMTTNAQNGGGDNWFRGGGDNYNDRSGGVSGVEWNGMTPQNPTEQAPLGSGLLVLVAAGAGYVALKKKED